MAQEGRQRYTIAQQRVSRARLGPAEPVPPHFSSLPSQKLTLSTQIPLMPSLIRHPQMMATWSLMMPSGL